MVKRWALALLLFITAAASIDYYVKGIPDLRAPVAQSRIHSGYPRSPATGPLRVYQNNPRYFTDGSGRAILLAGIHTWANLSDNGFTDPPPAFDYSSYLDFLAANNLNFTRLWVWEQVRWAPWLWTDDYYYNPGPPYERTGPGKALDGKPKFNLDWLSASYFTRLRSRVIEARERGIYVAIMLFNRWNIDSEHGHYRNPWKGHPFNSANNVNGIDGDPNGDNSGSKSQSWSGSTVNTTLRRRCDSLSLLPPPVAFSLIAYTSSYRGSYRV